MGDAIKWGLLVAGIVVIIAAIMALPFVEFIDLASFGESLTTVTSIVGGFFYKARCLLNNFFSPVGRVIFSGLLIWLIGKWAIKVALNIVVWVYHFIFK